MNKNKIYLLLYILLISLSLIFTNKYTIIIPPLILVILIFYLYNKEIKQYNFNELLSDITISNWIFYSIAPIMALQTIANLIMSHLLHSTIHTLSQSVMMFPTTAVFSVILAPIIEETIFRKIIFKWLNIRLNFWLAAIISSLLFAAGHGSLVALLGYTVVGISLCWIYKRSGNLGVVILIHAFINFFVILSVSLHMTVHI